MRTDPIVARSKNTRRLPPPWFVILRALLLLLTLAFSRQALLPLQAGGPCISAPAGLAGWWRAEATGIQ